MFHACLVAIVIYAGQICINSVAIVTYNKNLFERKSANSTHFDQLDTMLQYVHYSLQPNAIINVVGRDVGQGHRYMFDKHEGAHMR